MSVHEFYRLKALITLEQVNTSEKVSMGWWLLRLSAKIWALLRLSVASHAGIFRGARFSSFVGRNEKRAPLKTPAWEARLSVNISITANKKVLKNQLLLF